ncbi:jg16639 [Pararge aegeria aegeria]|uniref:Jg16639 protein n=1 Tax=Pararge aegeria aegeria TaxID=348720 RepID=A0A8S4RBX3_9NEOP|nr:jg16639 [Pararge aegeria aegeria]
MFYETFPSLTLFSSTLRFCLKRLPTDPRSRFPKIYTSGPVPYRFRARRYRLLVNFANHLSYIKAILEELGITQRLSSIVQARILTFFGHVSRRDNDSIERLVVQGRIEGTRSRGRSPMRWADQIKAAVAFPLHECARKAAAREEW